MHLVHRSATVFCQISEHKAGSSLNPIASPSYTRLILTLWVPEGPINAGRASQTWCRALRSHVATSVTRVHPLLGTPGATGGHCQIWGWMSRWWAARWWPSLFSWGWAGDPEASFSRASRPWERDPVNRPGVRVRTAGSSISTLSRMRAAEMAWSLHRLFIWLLRLHPTSTCFYIHANHMSQCEDNSKAVHSGDYGWLGQLLLLHLPISS